MMILLQALRGPLTPPGPPLPTTLHTLPGEGGGPAAFAGVLRHVGAICRRMRGSGADGSGLLGRGWLRVGAVVAVFLILTACGGDAGMPARLEIGDPLPEFSLPALDGSEVESGSLAGKVVVLNFWATWCQPCLKEIPELKALAADDRLEVVGIALDQEGESAVRPFTEEHGMDYRILLGNQEVFLAMGGIAIPYTLVLDPSLRVINVYRGPATRADVEEDLAGLAPEA